MTPLASDKHDDPAQELDGANPLDKSVLSLPWQIQLSLGAGYVAYVLSYAGIRAHHTATDTAFRSAAFGIVTLFTLTAFGNLPVVVGVPLAIFTTLAAGILWRKPLRNKVRKLLHHHDVSWADDTPTAWQTITVCNSTHPVSQICVELEDGTWLRCIDTRPFDEAPFGPLTLGGNGDVAMYVTSEQLADGTEVDIGNVVEDYWGARITYVPAAKIRRVTIRHHKD